MSVPMSSYLAVALVQLPLFVLADADGRTNRQADPPIWDELFVTEPPASPASPPASPDVFAFDDDVLHMLSEMSLEQKVGQMTQIDVTQLVSYTGDCYSNSLWEDPVNCQPELNYDRLRSWLRDYQIGSILNSPYSAKCIKDKCGWTVHEWRTFVRTVQQEARALGVVPPLFGLDTIHGANYVHGATMMPQQINVAATFNRTLAYEFGRIGAKDTRAAGVPWLFSPILGIATKPLWARVYETFGEDPFVAGQMGVQVVKGIQAIEPGVNASTQTPHRAAACLKHFIAYSSPKTGHDRTPVDVPERALQQYRGSYYVPPFRTAVEAGALTVMEGYHEVNDVPVVASNKLLRKLLRDQLAFRGVLVTDWAEIKNLHAYHKVARSDRDAVLLAINHTSIDMSMVPIDNSFPRYLTALVTQGLVAEARIDESVVRILQLKKTLGLLVPSPSMPGLAPAPPLPLHQPFIDSVGSSADHDASLALARESIVLLKNEAAPRGSSPLLPLATPQRILVVGPTAHSVRYQTGGWSGHWQGLSREDEVPLAETIYSALKRLASDDSTVEYDEGCIINSPNGHPDSSTCDATDAMVQATATKAARADVVVLCLGEEAYTEKPGDIHDLKLQAGQRDLSARLGALGVPTVLVLVQGRPRLLDGAAERAQAIVYAMLPGPHGGAAVGEVLLGLTNPSGRLPITYPREPGLQIQHWHRVSQRCNALSGGGFLTAATAECPVQWPFGRGLSYTHFRYSEVGVSESLVEHRVGDPGRFELLVTVTNVGSKAGRHSVLAFLVRQYQMLVTPDAQTLVGFEKIELQPGESRRLRLPISTEDLMYVDGELRRVLENGEHVFRVGIEGDCDVAAFDYALGGCSASVDITGGGILPSRTEPTAGVGLELMHLYVLHQQYLARWLKYLPFVLGLLCLCVGLCSREVVRCTILCACRLGNLLRPAAQAVLRYAGFSTPFYSPAPEDSEPLYKQDTAPPSHSSQSDRLSEMPPPYFHSPGCLGSRSLSNSSFARFGRGYLGHDGLLHSGASSGEGRALGSGEYWGSQQELSFLHGGTPAPPSRRLSSSHNSLAHLWEQGAAGGASGASLPPGGPQGGTPSGPSLGRAASASVGGSGARPQPAAALPGVRSAGDVGAAAKAAEEKQGADGVARCALDSAARLDSLDVHSMQLEANLARIAHESAARDRQMSQVVQLLEHIASAQDLSRCASGTLETDPGGAAPSAGVAAAPDAGAEPPPGTSAPPRPAAVRGDATDML